MSVQRGPRRRWARGADHGPRRLDDSLGEVLEDLAPPRGDADDARGACPGPGTWTAVFARWEEVVGEAMARHVRPLRLDGTTLVVAVDQPPWATQLRVLAPRILERVGALAGEPLEALEVVVRPAR